MKIIRSTAIAIAGLVAVAAIPAEAMPITSAPPWVAFDARNSVQTVQYGYGYGYRRPFGYGFRRPYGYRRYGYGWRRPYGYGYGRRFGYGRYGYRRPYRYGY